MPRAVVFSLRHLEGFALLCRRRSFAAAARELNLTQSALTQAVAGIERKLNRKLFDRGPRGAQPIAAAEALADSIRRAVSLLNETGRAVVPAALHRMPLTRRASATQLFALTAVEQAGSFRRGARIVGMSEASIHRAVRALEAAIGVPLIVSAKTGICATPAAVAICAATRRAQAELESGFAAVRTGSPAILVIGVTPTLRAGHLPQAIAELCRHDRNLHFRVEESPRLELISGLLAGRIDLLLCPFSAKVPEGILQHHAFDEVLEVVARSGHPLFNARRDPRRTAITDYPWIANAAESPRRVIWEELFRAKGVEPPLPMVECKSFESMRELLLNTDSLGLLAPEQFRVERECGLLKEVRGLAPAHTRRIVIVTRASWIPDATEIRLIDVLRRAGAAAERARQSAPAWSLPT
jgi:DNA-binding transcriptional LysR family regulator